MQSHPNKQIFLTQEENMSKELAVQDDFNRQMTEMDNIHSLCKKLLQTKHYQKFGEEGIIAILARAKTIGLHPFEALNNGFFIISGKVGMYTEMMATLVRRKGHSITKDPKSNNECVILHGKRSDTGDVWTCSFTKDDAIAAGLWNTATWKKYPGIMLYNRCMSMLFRQLFPDLSLGAGYTKDEVQEISGDKNSGLEIAEAECEDVTPQKTKKIDFTVNSSDKPTDKSTDSTDKKQEEPKISGAQVKILEDLEPLLDDDCRKGVKLYMIENKLNSFAELNQRQFNRFLKSFNENIKKQDAMPIEVSEEGEVSVAEDG